MFRDAFGPDYLPSVSSFIGFTSMYNERAWGYRSQPMLACRFGNRVVTASDSVDTSRMERLVLCACVVPEANPVPRAGHRCWPKGTRHMSGGGALRWLRLVLLFER